MRTVNAPRRSSGGRGAWPLRWRTPLQLSSSPRRRPSVVKRRRSHRVYWCVGAHTGFIGALVVSAGASGHRARAASCLRSPAGVAQLLEATSAVCEQSLPLRTVQATPSTPCRRGQARLTEVPSVLSPHQCSALINAQPSSVLSPHQCSVLISTQPSSVLKPSSVLRQRGPPTPGARFRLCQGRHRTPLP